MIWVGGRLASENELSLSASDRTLEHGVGLFETMRTWNRRPSLLARHLARLERSAAALHLPLERKALPDANATTALIEANGFTGDALLRLTVSGGTGAPGSSVVWMRTGPLPAPVPATGASIVLAAWHVSFDDPLARHKTLNYWGRRLAQEWAQALQADEALLATPDGRLWEGTRTNLFLVSDGALVTPSVNGPVLPGVMRGLVLELAREQGIAVREADVTLENLRAADEVFLTNAARGIVPVGQVQGRVLQAPGPLTERLREIVGARLTLGDAPNEEGRA